MLGGGWSFFAQISLSLQYEVYIPVRALAHFAQRAATRRAAYAASYCPWHVAGDASGKSKLLVFGDAILGKALDGHKEQH